MNVYIIETPGLTRSLPIHEVLKKSPFFNLISVPAIMFKEPNEIPDRFFSQFSARYGRPPLAGEYGCLLSHKSIWEKIVVEKKPAIVLEDDARDIDEIQLESLSSEFIRKHGDRASVLSFHDPRFRNRSADRKFMKYIRLFGTSSHAVAYLVTPSAAQELLRSSGEYASVADWPNANVVFWISPRLIRHGDSSTSSVISSLGPRDNLKSEAIFKKILLMHHYRENQNAFRSFGEYFKVVVAPRLKIKVDSLILRFMNVRSFDNSR